MSNDSNASERRVELYGPSGMNVPILNSNTSGRLTMSDGMNDQIPVIESPTEAIVDTGFSEQIIKHSFDIVIENDSIFIGISKKFNNRFDGWSNDEWSSVLVFFHDTVKHKLVHYEIPKYRILDNKFGFSYIIDEETIFRYTRKDFVAAGTRLAWTNSTSGNSYKKGRDLNTFIGSLPGTGEDALLVNRDAINNYAIKTYSTYEASYGKSAILANVHGDDTKYKAYLDIGDTFEPGDVLYSKLNCDLKSLTGDPKSSKIPQMVMDAPLFTKAGLRSRRPYFTNNVLMKNAGKVVDIDIVYNSKPGETAESDMMGHQTATYLMMLQTYHTTIYDIYELYKRSYSMIDGSVSPATNNVIVESMLFLEKPINNTPPSITKEKKRSILDMYTLKITCEHTIFPNNGFKWTDRVGGKGTLRIVEPEDMPRDANGVVSDIAMLSRGIIARTNLGKLYEQYFAAVSRQTKLEIIDILGVTSESEIDLMPTMAIDVAYDYLLSFFSHFNTKQFKAYSGYPMNGVAIADTQMTIVSGLTLAQKVEILKEVFSKEIYIIYNISEEESAYNIVNRLEDSRFKLRIVDVFVKSDTKGEFRKVKGRAFIAPMHIVMLNKITDDFLGSSTFFLNAYGLLTSNSKNDGRFPYKFKSVKAWGESEIRLLASYGSPRLMQILMDRSRSVENHRQFYRNQLRSGSTVTESLIPDRVEDSDVAINILKAIIEPAGLELDIKGGDYEY